MGTSATGKKIYAIIISYNSEAYIDQCLISLKEASLPLDILVIDNHSTDRSAEIIRTFSNVHFIQQKNNIGFGQANNIGFQRALKKGADYVFLLNADAWIKTGALEELVTAHEEHPGYGILSPMHLNGEGTLFDQYFYRYITELNSNGRDIVSSFYIDPKRVKKIYEAQFVNAAAWLVSKKCLQKVGGFEPLFHPAYGEDIDYVNRARFHGFKIGIVCSAIAYHDREDRLNRNTTQSVVKTYHASLSKLLDINNVNWIKRYFSLCYDLSRDILFECLKFDFDLMTHHFHILKKIIFSLRAIRRSRARNISGGWED